MSPSVQLSSPLPSYTQLGWPRSTPMADPVALLGQDAKGPVRPGRAAVRPGAWRPGSPPTPARAFAQHRSSPAPGPAVPLRGPLSALPLRQEASQSGLVRSQDLTCGLGQARSFRQPHFCLFLPYGWSTGGLRLWATAPFPRLPGPGPETTQPQCWWHTCPLTPSPLPLSLWLFGSVACV